MIRIFTISKLLLLLLVINANQLFAQTASSYGFQAVSGTFTEITGTPFAAVEDDDAFPSATIPIGFSFNFCGTNYTTIRAGSNGFMGFGTGSGGAWTNSQANLVDIRPGLMWLWDDLDGSYGTAVYATSGTAPNRVFTMQFKNWYWNLNSSDANISVQVKLYESTNVIEYVYRQEAAAGSPSSASIGIVDGTTQNSYLSLNNSTATATASSSTFTTSISTRPATGQIFKFTPPMACNLASGMPTSGTVASSVTSFCGTGMPSLSFTPSTPMPATTGITYQWKSGLTATGPFTNIAAAVTTNPNYTLTTAITANTYFVCEVLCNGTPLFTSSSVLVEVVNPATPTANNASRCGAGTVSLSATGYTGSTLYWYNTATGGLPIATGSPFVTPVLASNANYYVSAGTATVSDSVSIGAGASTGSSTYTPFNGGWGGYKYEFLITQAELAASGIMPGTVIKSLSMWQTSGTATYNGFTLSVGSTTANALTTTFQTGTTAVYGPTNHTTTSGRLLYTFSNPYSYTGGNLVIQTCWSNSNSSNTVTYVRYDATTFTSQNYNYGDNQSVATICGYTSGGSTSNYRPKFTFEYDFSCQSDRVPVTVTVTPAAAVTTSQAATVCNNEVTPINVTSTLSNYNSYVWTSLDGGDLFTDAAATNAYTNTSLSTIYYRSSVAGPNRIVLASNNSTTICASLDTITIYVQPSASQLAILSDVDTLCRSGVVNLSLSNAIVQSANIDWQGSTNGTTYTNLTIGTLPYTSPVLTDNQYYRALIKKNATTVCDTLYKLIVVSDPVLDSIANGNICGAGTANLFARANNGGTVQWFTSPTSILPIYSGNNFTTPVINTSTTYYALATSIVMPEEATLGAGLLNSSSNYTPFRGGYGGYKFQFLITEAELASLGILPGTNINSISLIQTSGTSTYNGFTLSVGSTSATALNTTFQTGLTPVFGPVNYTTTAGRMKFDFGSAYSYTGGNLVIQTCWSNNNYSNTITYVKYDQTSNVASNYRQRDAVLPSVLCSDNVVTGTYSYRPQFIFEYDELCKGVRTPVTATVSTAPLITTNSAIVVCNNELTPVSVTSTLANYNSYTWSVLDGGDLFTDAAGTQSYNNTSESTIYFRSNVAGSKRLVLLSNNTASTCSSLDTISVFVQPNASQLAILSDIDSICVSGAAVISLSDSLFASGSIDWQRSSDGIAYTNFTPATIPFTTAVLTNNDYYRVFVRKSATEFCDTINKMIYVNSPEIDSVANGSRCGPGSVELYARGKDNTPVYWYESLTNRTPLFMGNTFMTPSISNATTYYAASVSSSVLDTVQVGLGTLASATYDPGPFNRLYYYTTSQMLYTAAEIIAAGGSAGDLSSVALKCVNNPSSTFIDYTVSFAFVPSTQTTLTNLVADASFTNSTVFATYTPTVGWNYLPLATPASWNGVDNIVVKVCYRSFSSWSSQGTHEYTLAPNMMISYYDDVSNIDACPFSVSNNSYSSVLDIRPNMKFSIESGCISNLVPVVANISEKPHVDLGPDLNLCVDAGQNVFLNAQNPGRVYEWDNNYNGQVRVINQSGTYWVEVGDGLGCSSSDTVVIDIKQNPISALGNDTTVCSGTMLRLNAGNDGIRYFWNTGGATSSITTNQSGTYLVHITGSNGCVKTDSITITHNGYAPSYNSVNVTNLGVYKFKFALRNPQNITNYEWDFGDGSPISYAMSPEHTFPRSGNYIVRFRASSSCGSGVDSIPIYIQTGTSINDVDLVNNIKVYPNPANVSLTIDVTNDALIQEVAIVNVTGQIVHKVAFKNLPSVQLDLQQFNSGVYQLHILTNKGIVNKKVTIVK